MESKTKLLGGAMMAAMAITATGTGITTDTLKYLPPPPIGNDPLNKCKGRIGSRYRNLDPTRYKERRKK